ncbi:hypothetical protein TNCV_4795421 [Trichonephila clavipes]|nr:hypothetical protein TNCV_4795421 [Trichonephila clavipes]
MHVTMDTALVNILGNEKADKLGKESRACPQSSNLTGIIDANPFVSRRLINNNFKYPIPAINSNRAIALIITRLRTKHVKGMKISTDGQSYTNHCTNYPYVQLSPQHILNCPAIQARLFKIGPEDTENLIFDKTVERLSKLCSTVSKRSKASFFYQSGHHGHANNNNRQ